MADMVSSSSSAPPAAQGSRGAGRGRRGWFRRHKPSPLEPAQWVWLGGPEPSSNTFLYFRKLFSLPSEPTRAILMATADTRYKLFVNGHYVGAGPVPSGAGIVYYDTYDIASLLSKGDNVIAFLVHYEGEPTTHGPGLLCKAEIDIAEEHGIVATDETWLVRPASDWTSQGERLGGGLGYQEVYDSAERIEDWNQVKFREKGWQSATVMGDASSPLWGKLLAREIPVLAEEKILPASVMGVFSAAQRRLDLPPGQVPDAMAAGELTEAPNGAVKKPEALTTADGVAQVKGTKGEAGVAIVLDFGREVFGNIEIGIEKSASGCIDIGYAEALTDGRVKPNRDEIRYTDRVLLKKGRVDWRSFEPRAFRYMQLEFRGLTRGASIEYVRVNQIHYPVQQLGSFECSDDLLNRIWQIGAYTTQLCMQDTFISSPWSERGQWWGDARVESRVAYYAFDDSVLLAQGLRQIAETQRQDGSIPGMYPPLDGDVIPDYALLWVFSILDYYAFSDDAELLRKLYPNVRRLLEWFSGFAGDEGLLANVPGRLFIDHADLEREGEVTALNCLYYQGLRVAGVIAGIVGSAEDAEKYTAAAAKLRITINKLLFSPMRGLYAEGRKDGKLVEKYSRQANILAALFDIPDHYRKSTICRQMLDSSLPKLATPYFTSYLLEVLYSADMHEEALDIIRRRWGSMVEAGATTFWEVFSQDGGRCHGWSACPTRDLIAEYVGIKPVLGSHRFSVSPHPGGLKWARGSVNTKFGPLSVDWRVSRDCLMIKVDVPQGLRVDIYPPGPPTSRISLDGKHQPGRFLTVGGGCHQIRVVVPRPEKPPKMAESLAPVAIDHVEVLGEVYSRWPRRERGIRRRGKARLAGMRDVAGAPAAAEVEDEVVEAAEELMEVTTGDLVETAMEAQVEGAEVPRTPETEAETERRSRRRRPRRGRRRPIAHSERGEDAAPAAELESVEEAVPAPEPVSEAPAAEAAEAETQAAPAGRRRRTRRGGRRHRSSHAAAEAEAAQPVAPPAEVAAPPPVVETPEAAPSAPEAADEAPAPKRRRRYSRSGSRRRKPAEPGEGPAEQPPAEPPHE